MKRLVLPLRARPRLVSSLLAGVGAALLLPSSLGPVARALVGWNLAVWLYLALMGLMMARADHGSLRRVATTHAEGGRVVLVAVVIAALVSLAGIVAELSAAKLPGAAHAWPHMALAMATVIGSWLFVPMNFALAYASLFHGPTPGALKFPDTDPNFQPHYSDFLYFSFTIAVASQTSDVCVASARMRRLVLLHAVVSFIFNTAILAFAINVAASMF